MYSGCDTCGEGASGRATLNGVARDSPGLVHQAGRRGAYVGNCGARRVEAGQRGRAPPSIGSLAISAVPVGIHFGSCPELS